MPLAASASRRLYLRAIVKLLFTALALGIGYVLFAPFLGGEEPAGRQTVDLHSLPPGAWLEASWRGRRVLIVHRPAETLAGLQARGLKAILFDDLPPGADPVGRSLDPAYLVVLGYGTVYGCALEFVGERFTDPCGGTRYDLTGRAEMPASQGHVPPLAVPPHRFSAPGMLVLGAE